MGTRYTHLFRLPGNLFTHGSPLIIVAGALIKDNQTGNILVQLKFKNISSKKIKAIKIAIDTFDISGEETAGISEYQYLDLLEGRDAEFGQKSALYLSENISRTFQPRILGIFFTDNTSWIPKVGIQWESIPIQQTLYRYFTDDELVKQYELETKQGCLYLTQEVMGLWLCACGSVNNESECTCHNCDIEHSLLKEKLIDAGLKIRMKERLQKEHETAKLNAEKEKAEHRRRKLNYAKTATAVVLASLVMIAFILILVNNIIPAIKYKKASDLLENRSYIAASYIFKELGDYRDSSQKLIESYLGLAEKSIKLNDAQEIAFSLAQAQHLDFAYKIFNFSDLLSTGLSYTVCIEENGKVLSAGYVFGGGCEVSDWTDVVAVSAGDYHTVGLKKDRRVVATGGDTYDVGQCDVDTWDDIIAISAGSFHTIGLRDDGTVVATGSNTSGQTMVSKWANIIAVSAGGAQTVGLKDNGTVVAVGRNKEGQCDVSDWTGIKAVSTGDCHTVGLRTNGTVVAIGDNRKGQCDVSNWTDVVAISAGDDYTVGLKADGTVVATGCNEDGQCEVSKWTDIVGISAGIFHTVGLKANGTVVATGSNSSGCCEVNTWELLK